MLFVSLQLYTMSQTHTPLQNNDGLFVVKNLRFTNTIINNEQINVPIKDAKFGILNLRAISAPISVEIHDLVFMIDCSASMSDACSDGRTKMHHIIHTLKNMILYFKENPDIKNHITINCFDEKIYNIIERCSVTSQNYKDIITKIDEILPRNGTNIELALQHIKETVDEIKMSFPQHNISTIFMTDGDVTVGNRDANTLATLVDPTITNAFIGFGMHHDAVLLNTISSGDNSAYYFIDKLENSGYVYGEILHDIVYRLLKNIQINVENGFIYDFKKNIWTPSLSIGEIVSEANKIYHICSNNSDECQVNIKATSVHSAGDVCITIVNEETDEDLTKYHYRQRTLQHLFIVKDFLKRKRDENKVVHSLFEYVENTVDKTLQKDRAEIQQNMTHFIKEMKQFMTENNLNEDKIMKQLCDDIYICYQMFDTKFGDIYVSARLTSQGTQRCYTACHTPCKEDTDDDREKPLTPVLKRGRNRSIIGLPPPLMHNVSNIADAPYLTPSSAKIMREISGKCDLWFESSSEPPMP